MHPDDRLEQLFAGLPNFERTRTRPGGWSLDTTRALLPPSRGTGSWVQVGGSKGKGTTVAWLEGLARAAGKRTGAYLSPHVEHVTERVRIDGAPVAAAHLVEALEEVLARAAAAGLSPSFFEAMTAAAVALFRAARLDLVVLEVGLGGRLDATTAVPVDAAILTRIELEHTDLLGDTVALIAAEKAFVMRPSRPCFHQADPAVDEVLRAHAARVGASLHPGAGVAEVVLGDDAIRGAIDGRPFCLPGACRFEVPAFALAVRCLTALWPGVPLPIDPAPRVRLPGRFEILALPGGTWILDGAHTTGSMAEVAAELGRRFPGEPAVLLFATAADKRWREALKEILPRVDRVLVTALEGTRGTPPEAIVAWLTGLGAPARAVASPAMAVAELARAEGIRLVAGSFYLVGAVRRLLLPR